MKNQPANLYLQIFNTDENTEWDDLDKDLIIWHPERAFDNDIAYISKESLLSFLSARIKEIEQDKSAVNINTMTGGSKMNRLRGIQKELKQIIESFK